MEDLIYDSYSIFQQLLQLIAPDYVGEIEFQLLAFALSGLFVLLSMWFLYGVACAFARSVFRFLGGGW